MPNMLILHFLSSKKHFKVIGLNLLENHSYVAVSTII